MSEFKQGDIASHRLTGDRVIVIGENVWGQILCRTKDYESKWFEPEELYLEAKVGEPGE